MKIFMKTKVFTNLNIMFAGNQTVFELSKKKKKGRRRKKSSQNE